MEKLNVSLTLSGLVTHIKPDAAELKSKRGYEKGQCKNLFLTCPPKVVYISSSRLLCAKNGDFQKMIEGEGSAVAFAWFVWVKGYKGDTIIKWFN